MDAITSPSLPPTSDPALHDDWNLNPVILPSSSHSDELEAVRLTLEESIAQKNKDGLVIQHRAWKVGEAFRSDPDQLPDTPLRERSINTSYPLIPSSSPPTLKMPSLISSPVTYPPSSSPPAVKRPHPATTKSSKPRTIGGFLQDDSDEEDVTGNLEPAPKRRMLYEQKSTSPTKAEKGKDWSELSKTQFGDASHARKPRTIGGFLIDDAEDEEEPPNTAAAQIPESLHVNTVPDVDRENQLAALYRPSFLFSRFADRREIRTCSGKAINVRDREKVAPVTFEELIAARSTTKAGRAKKSYYGIDIHQLIEDGAKQNADEAKLKPREPEVPLPSIEISPKTRPRRTLMWTEKYRARRFFDLVGDDRTHREVLRWLKGWDPIVFPRAGKPKPIFKKRPGVEVETEEKPHRKILLLTGPPGLGKTTLAHVCALQAGYEIMEINASDERSSNVVKGRIRTTVGTESVKSVSTSFKDGKPQKLARPVCVVVDEVDGVVSGSGGSGEGGFIKALIDLIQLDAKNETGANNGMNAQTRKKQKGDNFRLLRPLILICNDAYHPSLRPLRQSSFAEIIHIRKPPLEAAVNRMKGVFEKEGVLCDNDGVRKLCEATWGMSSGPEARLDASGSGEGDLRSLLVVGEWVAGKLRSSTDLKPKLTRKWVEKNMLNDLSHGGGGARGVGRGGVKEVVSRVFLTGAGFPNAASQPFAPLASNKSNNDPTVPRTKLHASEIAKKAGMDRLREMVDTSGDIDRIVTDLFSLYPSQPFNDDNILSKPDSAYEWLNFYDSCSSRVYSDQSWELMPYLNQPVLACHHLFASPARHYSGSGTFEQKKWGKDDGETEEEIELPFSGPRADYDAKEAEKSCRATIQELQSNLNAALLRSFRSPEEIATDLLPYLVRLLTPDVKPIIVGGSGDQRGIASVRREGEREMVKRAVDVMNGVGVKFERGKLEGDFGSRGTQWVYRMEPPLDILTDYPTAIAPSGSSTGVAPVRYAVRQVLDQEFQKSIIVRENAARQARYRLGNPDDDAADYNFSRNPEDKGIKRSFEISDVPVSNVKKDFFGRVIVHVLGERDGNVGAVGAHGDEDGIGNGQGKAKGKGVPGKDDNKVWVSFHEGFSNAVRKPLTVEELLRGL